MKFTPVAAPLAFAWFVSACVAPKTLTQRLAETPPAERHALLMKACMREAATSGGSAKKPQFYAHARRMGEICTLFDAEHKKSVRPSSAPVCSKK